MDKITLGPNVIYFACMVKQQALRNQYRILFGNNCACYNCCSSFNKEKITHWLENGGNSPKTALCPICGSPSVMDDNEIPGLNPTLVKLVHLFLSGHREVSRDQLFYWDPTTDKKVFFDVIEHGDHFETKVLE